MKLPNLKYKILFSNSYVLSGLFHLLLVILAALWYLHPQVAQTWHQFEWELPNSIRINESPRTQGQLSQSHTGNLNDETPLNQKAALATPQNDTNGAPKSELPLELPNSQTTTHANQPVLDRNQTSRILTNVGTGLPGGDNGFSAALESGSGDAYIITQPKPQINPTEDGEVVLEFRLLANGKVNERSVNIVSFTSGSYLEAVRKVIPSWKFGFRKAYQEQKMYRIRCRFVVNE